MCGWTPWPSKLPPQLRKLEISWTENSEDETNMSGVQSLVAAAAQLQHLVRLTMDNIHVSVDFSPLARAPALETLVLGHPFENNSNVSYAPHGNLLRTLCRLSNLRRLDCHAPSDALFGKQHHLQQLTSLQCCSMASLGETVRSPDLPLLSHVHVSHLPGRFIDFVCHLPALTELGLHGYTPIAKADTQNFVATLQTCTKLEELRLGCGPFISQQLATCLQHMPQLQSLKLSFCNALSSLSFLSAGTLGNTLTKLFIEHGSKLIPLFDDGLIKATPGASAA